MLLWGYNCFSFGLYTKKQTRLNLQGTQQTLIANNKWVTSNPAVPSSSPTRRTFALGSWAQYREPTANSSRSGSRTQKGTFHGVSLISQPLCPADFQLVERSGKGERSTPVLDILPTPTLAKVTRGHAEPGKWQQTVHHVDSHAKLTHILFYSFIPRSLTTTDTSAFATMLEDQT